MSALPERFLRRIELEPDTGCWLWVGYLDNGYGRIKINKRLLLSHRVVYAFYKGPIPEGLELDHLCKERSCCNPEHLQPVTTAVNAGRSLAGWHYRQRTHCNHGHELTEANTSWWFDRRYKGNWIRRCKICKTLNQKRRRGIT